MTIPREPIASIPRPPALLEALASNEAGDQILRRLFQAAIAAKILSFEATGSPGISGGEESKSHNSWTHRVQGLPNTGPDGLEIPFAAGHTPADAGPDRWAVPVHGAPIDRHRGTPGEVRDRVLEAAESIPLGQLGATARALGTAIAARAPGAVS
jgi:hypothetical protein